MENNTQKLGELIKEVKIAMLTTAETDGTLRSRPMATQKTEFDGTLWFFTSASSPKVEEVEKSHNVNVSYADPNSNTYVSVTGTATLVRDHEKAKELWNPFLKAWFPLGLEDPDLALLHVTIEKAEFWDSPSSAMVYIAGFVKAIATGHAYTPSAGEHQKISL
jgi:general stress protein 26